jgi:hypothetical protein
VSRTIQSQDSSIKLIQGALRDAGKNEFQEDNLGVSQILVLASTSATQFFFLTQQVWDPPTAPPLFAANTIALASKQPGTAAVVRLSNTLTGTEMWSVEPYPSFPGEVRIAVGDVNRDGVNDLITVPGPTGGPHVKVFDGVTGDEVRSFFGFSPQFFGGVFVAVGDLDNDNYADIIVGADAGGGPHVRVFRGIDGSELFSFFAYEADFRGGVRVAAGDITSNGRMDIITGAGPGGGPHVRVFDGTNVANLSRNFFAYDPMFLGGVFVAAGDTNFDGFDDIVTGPGAGGGPEVRVFSGANPANVLSIIVPYNPQFFGGVIVAAGDINGDGFADVITGPGAGGGPHVRAFSRGNPTLPLSNYFGFPAAFTGGVHVAVPRRNSVVPLSMLVHANVSLPLSQDAAVSESTNSNHLSTTHTLNEAIHISTGEVDQVFSESLFEQNALVHFETELMALLDS